MIGILFFVTVFVSLMFLISVGIRDIVSPESEIEKPKNDDLAG